MLKVRILTDDRVRTRSLLAEHGLSLWIEKDDKRILFDTGQTSVYLHNAQRMGISPQETGHIVISHGHYDHCGGLQHLLPDKLQHLSPDIRLPLIHVHPDAFFRKLAAPDREEPSREVGIPFEISSYEWMKDRIAYNKQPEEIEKGVLLSGEIPRKCSFEEPPRDFLFEKNGCLEKDIMMDEQMLIIEDEGEIVIFLGCSHPGVINSIEYAQKLMPHKRIKLLVAGMHLDKVSALRLQKTIQYITDAEIKRIVPMHCTGFGAMCEIKRFLGSRCLTLCAGDTVKAD